MLAESYLYRNFESLKSILALLFAYRFIIASIGKFSLTGNPEFGNTVTVGFSDSDSATQNYRINGFLLT